MSSKNGNRYRPAFKFKVVLESLRAEGPGVEAEVARAYGIHKCVEHWHVPVTLSNWKKRLLERGAEVFGGKEEVKAYEKRIAGLERMLGQKEVEIALLKNFLGGH